LRVFSLLEIGRMVLAWAAILTAVGPAFAAATAVTPHRAVYRLTLEAAPGAPAIQSATGLIAFQWDRTCQTVEIDEAYSITLYLEDGGLSRFGASFAGIERLDGSVFRFRFEQSGAGETLAAEGTVTESPGGFRLALRPAGSAVRDLPHDLLFPAGHAGVLLDAARSGQRFLSHPVFDGSDLQGPAQISAVIGASRSVPDELGSRRAWPVTLSFFPYASPQETPSYRLTMLLRDNGIASDLRLDYGDFVLRGRLDTLEERPVPVCD